MLFQMRSRRAFERRKDDNALTVERKEKSPTKCVFEGTVGLHPVPPSTEFLGKEPSACVRVLGNQLPNLADFLLGVGSAPVPYFFCHEKYLS